MACDAIDQKGGKAATWEIGAAAGSAPNGQNSTCECPPECRLLSCDPDGAGKPEWQICSANDPSVAGMKPVGIIA